MKLGLNKLVSAASIASSVIGLGAMFVFFIIIHSVVSGTQTTTLRNLDATITTVSDIESATGNLETQIAGTNQTLQNVREGIAPLATGLRQVGNSLGSVAGIGSLAGIDVNALRNSSDSIKVSATKLEEVANDIGSKATGMSELAQSVGKIKNDIGAQKNTLISSRKSIEDIFNSIKLANFIFFISMVFAFGAIALLGVNGFVDKTMEWQESKPGKQERQENRKVREKETYDENEGEK